MLRDETLEEKEDRLATDLRELIAFEKQLTSMYKVPLFFEATRADNNVEFTVELTPKSQLIVDDNYEKIKIPRSYIPSPYGLDHRALPTLPHVSLANRLYPYSYVKEGVGYSKITKINASQKYNLFDEDFYVSTDHDLVELEVTVHSERNNKPQVIKLELNLKNIITNKVLLDEDGDD